MIRLPDYDGRRPHLDGGHVVVTAGLPVELLPLPPGHSEEQREAERVMLELLSARLGVNLQPRMIQLPSGVRLEVDGACDDPPIFCEAWAHQGAAKSAQRDKVAKDILKLLILKEAAREVGVPTPRLILLFGDAAAARACGGRSWKAEAYAGSASRSRRSNCPPRLDLR
jgi:hypothetical protein